MVRDCSPDYLAGLPVGIGSLPHREPQEAADVVLRYLPELPFLPELPRRSHLEHMGNNQSEGIPGATVSSDTARLIIDTSADLATDVEAFYEAYLAGDIDRFAISFERAAGAYAMLEKVGAAEGAFPCLKGQLTGPTTLGLIAKDAAGRALLYNDTFMDILNKATAMKAKWLQSRIAAVGAEAIIFFDEPMLQSMGSPTVPIERGKAIEYLNDVVGAVSALTGCHCCGNTDWSVLMESDIDIIAFDAYHYGETMALYPSALRDFLDRGGMLAWGIVPSTEDVRNVEETDLVSRLLRVMELVEAQGIDPARLRRQALITSSCGLGSVDVETAERALRLLADVSRRYREEIGISP